MAQGPWTQAREASSGAPAPPLCSLDCQFRVLAAKTTGLLHACHQGHACSFSRISFSSDTNHGSKPHSTPRLHLACETKEHQMLPSSSGHSLWTSSIPGLEGKAPSFAPCPLVPPPPTAWGSNAGPLTSKLCRHPPALYCKGPLCSRTRHVSCRRRTPRTRAGRPPGPPAQTPPT